MARSPLVDAVEQALLLEHADDVRSFLVGCSRVGSPLDILRAILDVCSFYAGRVQTFAARACTLLLEWLTMRPSDFQGRAERSVLATLIEKYLGDEHDSRKLQLLVLQRVSTTSSDDTPPKAQVVQRQRTREALSPFTGTTPLAVAEHLTEIDSALFAGVHASELLGCRWQKLPCSSLSQISARFDRLSCWTACCILRAPTNEARAVMVGNFIRVLEHLIELNNFMSAMSIISSLNMACIQRLKRIWKAVPSKTMRAFHAAEDLLSPRNNCEKYRRRLSQLAATPSRPPVLPYVGLALRDLVYIEDGNTLLDADQAINLDNILLSGTVIRKLLEFQTPVHCFELEPKALFYLEQLPDTELDEEALYAMSMSIQPLTGSSVSALATSDTTTSSSNARDSTSSLLGDEDTDQCETEVVFETCDLLSQSAEPVSLAELPSDDETDPSFACCSRTMSPEEFFPSDESFAESEQQLSNSPTTPRNSSAELDESERSTSDKKASSLPRSRDTVSVRSSSPASERGRKAATTGEASRRMESRSFEGLDRMKLTPRRSAASPSPGRDKASREHQRKKERKASSAASTAAVEAWSCKDVCDWLVEQKLGELQPVFAFHKIAGERLSSMADSDFRAIGVTNPEQLARLSVAIHTLPRSAPGSAKLVLPLPDQGASSRRHKSEIIHGRERSSSSASEGERTARKKPRSASSSTQTPHSKASDTYIKATFRNSTAIVGKSSKLHTLQHLLRATSKELKQPLSVDAAVIVSASNSIANGTPIPIKSDSQWAEVCNLCSVQGHTVLKVEVVGC